MKPLTLTVVTPSYNQGKFLSETIESVIGQEGDFNLDYIIVDGGSTDDSVDIIKRYANLLDEKRWNIKCRGLKFRWLSETDQGQADALMKGFRLAEGDILAWLNSDDTYLTGTLSKVAGVFTEHPEVHVVYGQSYYTDAQGEMIGPYPTGPFDLDRLPIFNYICQPSAFFRKNGFETVGGLDMNLRFVMDYDLWVRMAKQFKFIYLQEFLSTYRLHEESKTVSEKTALANEEEALNVAQKYFGWSPLNRVYGCCSARVMSISPSIFKKLGFPIVISAIFYSMIRYLYLNRGIRVVDFKSINPENIQKLFKTRINRYKEP